MVRLFHRPDTYNVGERTTYRSHKNRRARSMKTLAPESEEYRQDRAGKLPFHIATIGGTFQAMHLGHRQYLKLALRLADIVHISLTSDHYASTLKNYPVASFD